MANTATGSLVGQVVGSYRITGALGEGGMGTVYKALDEKLGRTVALKFIRADISDSEKTQQRFWQEAQAASAMDHPNVGTVHGIEELEDGRAFIVMAYYNGENLAQKVHRNPLPAGEAVGFAIQIAAGLAEAHSHHIVHRDIKSSNVIVTANGVVKIVDFGVARIIHSASTTLTAGVTGTVAYMSPEQASGKPVDERTDIWALAVVLWEMLTGQLPFRGANVPALAYSVVNSAPAPLPDDIPEALRTILYKALAKDPESRYQTAKEMQADLEGCLPAQNPAPARKSTRRELRRAMRSATGVSPIASSRRSWIVAGVIAPVLIAAAGLALLMLRPHLSLSGPRHIAVLPLDNVGNDPNGQALTDGLQESLTNRLSNLETGGNALWVVPAGELRRRKIADPAEAHRILGANLIVTGSVRRSSAGMELALHLIDPVNLRQINGDVLVDRTGDLAGLEDRAVNTLAKWMKMPAPAANPEGGSTRPAAYESYLKARGYMQRYDKAGNIDLAIAQYQEAVNSDPQFAVGWAGLADAYLAKYHGDQSARWLDQAMASGTRAAEINGQLAPVHVSLGRVQTDTGKLDLAADQFQRALDLDPRSSEALLGLALVYERQGRPADAAKTYERGAALRPDYWEGYNRLGDFYIRQSRPADAEAQFQRAVKLTPDNWVGYLNLGVALQLQNKYDESARALEKSIQLSPSYAAYSNLGNIYYRQMKPAQAAPLFEKAVAINGSDFRAWFNYALANRWLEIGGDKAAGEKAKTGYRRAQEILQARLVREPNNADVHERLAMVFAFFGQREEALRHLETARILDLKQDSFESVRAEVLELLGDRKQAIAALESALKHGMQLESAKRNPEIQGVLTDPNFKYQH